MNTETKLVNWELEVINESNDLDNKIIKLNNLICSKDFQELDIGLQRLISSQYSIMKKYDRILKERIKYFKNKQVCI